MAIRDISNNGSLFWNIEDAQHYFCLQAEILVRKGYYFAYHEKQAYLPGVMHGCSLPFREGRCNILEHDDMRGEIMAPKKKNIMKCADCVHPPREKRCMNPSGKSSGVCPTVSKKRLVDRAQEEYKKAGIAEFARMASIQEGECYSGRDKKPYIMHPVKPRILEICEFARKMDYRRLGLAFCVGLAKEAQVVTGIFEKQGFEVASIACKAGAVPKEEIGLTDSEKVFTGGIETMCNPILQAMALNDAGTDFNVLLGLCVGHDSLFFKYAEAPTTVLAVKDRVTGHNPLAAIYLSGNYYSWV